MVKGIVTFAHTVLNVDKISGFKDTVLKKKPETRLQQKTKDRLL